MGVRLALHVPCLALGWKFEDLGLLWSRCPQAPLCWAQVCRGVSGEVTSLERALGGAPGSD